MGTRLKATPLIVFGLVFAGLALMTRCTSSDPTVRSDPDASMTVTETCVTDGDCHLPPSFCNADGTALMYYTEPKCVGGRCQWQQATNQCPCAGNGCRFSSTTGSAQMPDPSDGAVDGADEVGDAPPDHATVSSPDGGSCAGADASVCELPPSVCADDRWMAYFTNASCVENRCRWDTVYRDCAGLGCVNSGCRLNITH